MGSNTIVRALKKAGDDETVVAIVFRVDSPGGSALASDLIWRQIQQVRQQKPVIASMGDVAASGGYYVSMGCDKIFASAGTLTGSIGVVGGKIALAGLYDKVGLSTEVISRGRHSGMLSMDQPFSETERKVWQEYMEDVYEIFASKVAAGRKMDRTRLDALAGGRIWTGQQARENGLVDEIGTLYDAIEAAKKTASVRPDERIELLELPEPRNFFDQLFDVPVEETRAQLRGVVDDAMPAVAKRLGELETLRRLFAEPALMMMPFQVEIR
jgi:protease-4